MSTIAKEKLIEDLKASTQNARGMFEISEDTICALMSLLTNAAPQLPQQAVVDNDKFRADFDRWMVEDERCIVGSSDPYPAGVESRNWRAWNACRAAMLQSGNFREIAETSTNYPVIPSEVLSAIQKVARVRADFDDFDGDRRGIGNCLDEAEQELIVTINKHASVIAVAPQREVNK